MTRSEIIEAAKELAACIEGQDEGRAKVIAFNLLVEALVCLRTIADNTTPVKPKVE
ncbi:hypothetical protein [Mesorhizobium sp. M2D.F.Ca.ET.232.01.1.1]|uniref:hypothetical protein n=1 Tax=Mesorhizobium sp. M2D.F.Ca.ET.232.01.1.1 TaxID=2496670 RepID=UPI00167C2FD0|nr:hypothetical protein [Mesorhizobium sp. M2D.F.Ca.ET.232.01.1.1]